MGDGVAADPESFEIASLAVLINEIAGGHFDPVDVGDSASIQPNPFAIIQIQPAQSTADRRAGLRIRTRAPGR